MKLKSHGKNTSVVEVTHIDSNGFWILIDQKEHYLSFADFPWFKDASVANISRIERVSKTHLHWSSVDVDLTLDMIDNPENYSLRYK